MLKPAIYLIIGALLIFGYIKYIENHSIFFPVKNIEYTPDLINLSYENVYIKTSDNIQINAWFIPARNAKYTILFFHGNAGNIGHRLDKIKLLHELNVNIFIIDYRGYGRSHGLPSEHGLYIDAKTAYEYLLKSRNINPQRLILYGESLGGTVAIRLADEFKAAALIVEGTFSNIRDMAAKIYPLIPQFIFSNKFDSLPKVKKINIPKLFIHSKTDEIVPLALAKKLYAQANQPKQFIEITGGHNSAFLDSKQTYVSCIASFIQGLN